MLLLVSSTLEGGDAGRDLEEDAKRGISAVEAKEV